MSEQAKIRLKDALENILDRIGANPDSFIKAVGGKSRAIALFAILKFAKQQIEKGVNPEIEVSLEEVKAWAKKVHEVKQASTPGTSKTGSSEHWVLKL